MKRTIIAVYDYQDIEGRTVFQTVRFNPKSFAQRRPYKDDFAWGLKEGWYGCNGDGRNIYPMKGFNSSKNNKPTDNAVWLDQAPLILYKYPELQNAIAIGEQIYICEGEKDVETLFKMGLVATTNPMGAGKWSSAYTDALKETKNVVIMADKDASGRNHAAKVAHELHAVGVAVKIIELPDMNHIPVKDVSDWVAVGGTKEELMEIIQRVPDWAQEVNVSDRPTLTEISSGVSEGERNDSLARIVGTWAANGDNFATCLQKAMEWNQKNTPPMDEKELKSTVSSIYNRHQTKLENLYNLNPGQIKAVNVAKKICQDHSLICAADTFYQYKSGYYSRMEDEEVNKIILELMGESLTRHKLNEIISFIKTVGHVRINELNSAQFLNLKNGLFIIDKKELLPHSENNYFTIQLPVQYNPEAKCPLWFKTLDEIFQGNLVMIALLHEIIGLCLTKETIYEKAFIFYGEGANGKSVILHIIRKLIGEANCSAIPFEKFNNSFYLSNLHGKLVNISIETNAKSDVYDSMFKAIVSGDPIEVDQKNKIPFTFVPFCKIIIATNNLPRVDDKTDAFFRRLIILPFSRQFADDEQNKRLKFQLENELDGIFIEALKGLERLRKRGGFKLTPEITAAVEEYRKENNNVLMFVEEICDISTSGRISKQTIYDHYSDWCRTNGHLPLSKVKFGKQLRKHFKTIEQDDTESARGWKGIRIKSQHERREDF